MTHNVLTPPSPPHPIFPHHIPFPSRPHHIPLLTPHHNIPSFPTIFPSPSPHRDFQSVIGKESRAQLLEKAGKLPVQPHTFPLSLSSIPSHPSSFHRQPHSFSLSLLPQLFIYNHTPLSQLHPLSYTLSRTFLFPLPLSPIVPSSLFPLTDNDPSSEYSTGRGGGLRGGWLQRHRHVSPLPQRQRWDTPS